MEKKVVLVCGYSFSGKTTIINILEEKGYSVFNSDKYIRQIYKKGEEGYKKIYSFFGNEFVINNEVNRKKLGNLVFNSKNDSKKLNSLIQPLIAKQIVRLSYKVKGPLFVELKTAIDYPNYYKGIFYLAWIIKCSEKVLDERIKEAKLTQNNSALKNIGKINYKDYYQKAKSEFNNFVMIDNSKTKLDLIKQINKALKCI